MPGISIVHRLMALLVLLMFVAPVGFGVYAGTRKFEDLRAEWGDELERFDKVRSIAEFDVSRLAQSDDATGLDRLFLGREPIAVLAAKLQAKLREIAARHGVEILQASDLATAEIRQGMAKTGTRVQVVGLYSGILELFHEINRAEPMLLVENIDLHSTFADQDSQQTEPPMTASFDVWGLASTGFESQQQ